jgi:hypothetical protein
MMHWIFFSANVSHCVVVVAQLCVWSHWRGYIYIYIYLWCGPCQPNVGDGKPDLYSKAHNFRMQDICGSHRAIWMEGRFAPRYLVAVECLDDTWWYVLWRHDPAGEW